MGHVERETQKLVRTLSSDPAYGRALAWVWGGMLALGAIGGLIAALRRVPAGVWEAGGIGLGVLGIVITLVVVANKRA